MTTIKSKDNLTTKSCLDDEDEKDKQDVQSPSLTTTKTKKHNKVTLKNMIMEKTWKF